MDQSGSTCNLPRRVLLVAYHFPPQKGSSGVLRALKFARYLPDCNWVPVVLSVNPRAYEYVDDSQLGDIPRDVEVIRTFSLDTRRDLSFRGRYWRMLALPDRWVSWCFTAIPQGWWAIRRKNIDAIITTFPIPSAVLIGLILHLLSRKPWIVDFRDSMTEEQYPFDRITWRLHRWIERQAVARAARLIFTAPSTKQMYLARYARLAAAKCVVIPNGYDEEDFRHLNMRPVGARPAEPLHLVHTGLVYPWERDPLPFFRALARLKQQDGVTRNQVQVILRGSGFEAEYRGVLRQLGIDDIVCLLPPTSYHEALQEGALADAVLVLQAANCNHQIPAKVYEYLRLQKPILALTDMAGDTAALLQEAGGATILDIADENAIYAGLANFLSLLRSGSHPVPRSQIAERYSRKNQTYELATCLSELLQEENN